MTQANEFDVPEYDVPEYDVIVAGGGPAGATAATLVAQKGHRVLLVERDREPRFKVGESLMPATYWTFERLGMIAKMKASRFVKKQSVQFFSGDGRGSSPFYFTEFDPHESSHTWQVVRKEFDQMLLDNAIEHGVEVRRGVTVREVLFDGDPAQSLTPGGGQVRGVELVEGDGEPQTVSCKVVVDATGQKAMLAQRFGLSLGEPNLRNASIYTHYKGAYRDPGIDEGATVILHTQDQSAWFWYIPLPDDTMSVGVVGPVESLIRGRQGGPEQIFAEELARCPVVAERVAGATQVMEIKVARDFTYRASQMAGNGWVLAGDAFGFIDPIYSTGVFLALKSAEMAADSIHSGLVENDLSATSLGRHGECFIAGMEAMRRLVYAYYDSNFSFADFLRAHPHFRKDLIHMLVGNVYREPVGDFLAALSQEVQLPGADSVPAAAGAWV
jgi:flavin-dependent dehydrogenase